MSRARDDDDGDDNDRRDEPIVAYPAMVGWAARAWIVFGLLILLSGGANVAMQLTQGTPDAPQGKAGASIAGSMCGMALVLLFGVAFIWVGSQTLRGDATDTMGNGIGSLSSAC